MTVQSNKDFVETGRGAYTALFDETRANVPGDEPPWLTELRADAIHRFSRTGFPSPRNEDWKYTNLTGFLQDTYPPALSSNGEIWWEMLAPYLLEDQICHSLVFVNGLYRPDLSDIGSLPEGVILQPLSTALKEHREQCQAFLVAGAGGDDASPVPLDALNLAFMADGAALLIGPNTVLKQPVHLVFVTTVDAERKACHPRNLIEIGTNSSATLLESYIGPRAETYWINAVTDVKVRRGSSFRHYKHQEEGSAAYHLGRQNILLESNTDYQNLILSRGAMVGRNETVVDLVGVGASCRLDGVYLARGDQKLDHRTVINHRVPSCTSRQMFKGVIDAGARGAFQGKIHVSPNAQHTDSSQTNHNLLLSRNAEADTKPELEIFADDVKCSHGATVGELDADMLFYLEARGIDPAAARTLLVEAFAAEVTDQAEPKAVAQLFRDLIAEWMHPDDKQEAAE